MFRETDTKKTRGMSGLSTLSLTDPGNWRSFDVFNRLLIVGLKFRAHASLLCYLSFVCAIAHNHSDTRAFLLKA